MQIETDEEFERIVRERFTAKPYPDWTAEMYDNLVNELLETQRQIRAMAVEPPKRDDASTPDECDLAIAGWAIWSIMTRDVGAYPTHWHRVWSAVRQVAFATRTDERRRIAEALRKDQANTLGPTATTLIESVIASEVEWD